MKSQLYTREQFIVGLRIYTKKGIFIEKNEAKLFTKMLLSYFLAKFSTSTNSDKLTFKA
jgi:hypothetical protein